MSLPAVPIRTMSLPHLAGRRRRLDRGLQGTCRGQFCSYDSDREQGVIERELVEEGEEGSVVADAEEREGKDRHRGPGVNSIPFKSLIAAKIDSHQREQVRCDCLKLTQGPTGSCNRPPTLVVLRGFHQIGRLWTQRLEHWWFRAGPGSVPSKSHRGLPSSETLPSPDP